MYAAERQQRIIAEARRAGRVEVTALADSLGVAAETVRRDLTALERRGSLRRVHGGAIPVERLEVEPTLATRSGRLADVKRRIAARALDELPSGGSIILDAGIDHPGRRRDAPARPRPHGPDQQPRRRDRPVRRTPASRSTSSAAASAARPAPPSATGPPAPSRTSSSTSRSSAPTASPSPAA